MKIVTKSFLVSALVIGLTGAAYAQSANMGANGMVGLQAGGINGTGMGMGLGTGMGMGLGTGAASPSPMPGGGAMGHATSIGGTGSVGSGPALNTMRANGTSLNMNPDPRAPNVAGRAFGSQ
ncbi:MAG: hypothetical protein QOC89_2857 [Paraburkholderia sp.]|jgi:hypothetical protein|uniref:hypothetical protein n=1 Tax=Paraburkholderia sp. TaxID=1926495 RepID=UPI002AFED5B0|nr:hypothetical protein [Paraburkholderia sp.]MEA3085160.1 hypothetical protein [Paraburkholderia sp.]MEA3128477.1 hypothetical protein [Paraburkholderia sp.]